jgi:hypothetical protein
MLRQMVFDRNKLYSVRSKIDTSSIFIPYHEAIIQNVSQLVFFLIALPRCQTLLDEFIAYFMKEPPFQMTVSVRVRFLPLVNSIQPLQFESESGGWVLTSPDLVLKLSFDHFFSQLFGVQDATIINIPQQPSGKKIFSSLTSTLQNQTITVIIGCCIRLDIASHLSILQT